MRTLNNLVIESSESKTDLCTLGAHFKTDKTPYNDPNVGHAHPYTAVYDLLFSPLRYKKIKLGEIGILKNASMKMWREYFPSAELYGYDNNETFLNRAKADKLYDTTYAPIDVLDPESIEAVLSQDCYFDILIDDAIHTAEPNANVINTAYKYLNTGGILIVEDVFRQTPQEEYTERIADSLQYYSFVSFVITEHELRRSGNWNNDRLLILVRNDKK
jgi:hypothetical protein